MSWFKLKVEEGRGYTRYGHIGCSKRFKTGVGTVQINYLSGGAIEVIRFSRSGKEKYRTEIRKDGEWRIGSIGIRRMLPPKDPIQRLIEEFDLPLECLHEHSTGEDVSFSGVKILGSLETKEPYTDGTIHWIDNNEWKIEVSSEHPARYVVIGGAKYYPHPEIWPTIHEIHVWGEPKIEDLASVIFCHLYQTSNRREVQEIIREIL